jgi:predicted transcriptional regulator
MSEIEPIYFPKKEELIKQIRKIMKDYGITQEDLAYNTRIRQDKISKMIGANVTFRQDIKYSDAQKIYNTLLKLMSPLENDSIMHIVTHAAEVEKMKGIIGEDETLSAAAQKMVEKGFTQLIVKDKQDNYVGIITDSMLLNRMLYPREKFSNWLKILGEQTIKQSRLPDRVSPYSENSTQAELGQVLIHRYGAAILEGHNKIGIVTRNDFMKLLK